jgi:hypothetical protein
MINFNKQNLPFFKFKKNTTNRLKTLLALFMMVMGMGVSWGQTYYSMSSGNYSESFTSWTTPSTGTNWSSVATASVGTIPVATNMTVSSAIFYTGATGGLQNGSTNIQFLSTGSTSSNASVAFDLNLNFTGRAAGTFSFDVATVNNSTGDRIGSLKVYYSTNGSSWTELTGTNLPYVAANNVVGSASISISLPSALDNQSTVKLRFYNYNGTATGTTGSRPKISIDNVAVSSTAASSTSTLAAYGTQPTSTITRGSTNVPLAGFSVTPNASADFTSVNLTGTTLVSGTDVSNVRIYRDFNGDGIINGTGGSADADVSTAAISFPSNTTTTINITNETGFSAVRNYLIVADVSGTGTTTPVGVSIGSGAFVTTLTTNSGSMASNSRVLANSAASDIIRSTGFGFTEPTNLAYGSYQSANITTSGAGTNNIKIAEFILRDGAGSSDVDGLATTLSSISFTVGNFANVRRLAIYDNTSAAFVGEVAVSVSATTIALSPSIVAADNGNRIFSVYASFNTTVTDNQQIQLTVSSTATTASTAGSGFAATNAGGAASDITGSTNTANKLIVTASGLFYTTQPPTTASTNTNLTTTPVVTAKDGASGSTDLDFAFTSYTISNSSSLTQSTTTTGGNISNGVFTFPAAFQFSTAGGPTTLTLTSGSLSANSAAGITVTVPTAVSDYFRSKASGNWATVGTWESSIDGSTNWITATLAPTTSANTVTILNGHTVTVAASVSADQLVINSGGQVTVAASQTLTVADGTGTDIQVNGTLYNSGTVTMTGTGSFLSGGTYTHNINGGSIPTASWDLNSTCNIIGITTPTLPTGLSQSFGNFTWNCSSQAASLHLNNTLTTINGNFNITNTNAFLLRLNNNADGNSTLSIGGNLTIGATSGLNLNFGASNSTGGLGTLNVSGNISIANGGIITNSSAANKAIINFTGSGTKTFSNSGTTFNNTNAPIDINVNAGTLQLLTNLPLNNYSFNSLNITTLTVANGATLDFGAFAIVNGTNTTATGFSTVVAPKFTLSTGASVITANSAGLISSGATGSVQTSGARSFSSGANYEFQGAATGTFTTTPIASTVNNLTINRSLGVALSQSLTTTGTLSLTSGTLTVGANTLTLSGSTINRDGTTYTGNIDASNASATVAFTNASALTIPASAFTGTCKNITMNGAGGITLGSDLTIGGTLTFTSGKIATGSNKVILTSAGSVSRTSGHVVGNLQKNVAVSATSRTFEIGDVSNYTPVTLVLTSVTAAGDLTASTTIPGAVPATASGIHPTKYLNRYWTLTNSGITLTSFDPTFTFVAGDIQGSAATSSFIGAKLTSSVWSNPTVGTLTSTSSQLTGVTTFGDFYLGELGTPSVTSSAASSISTTGAVLNGTVNDNGSTTTPGFDYGTTTSYGSSGTASPASISATTGATSVTSTISSLSVNTQYNFRANATNSLGTTNGSNLTFYTLANTPGTPTVNNPTNTTLDVLIDVNSNPSNTQFAIQETGGNYVQANGSLGVSAVWQTASVWGTKTVTGLSGGTVYAFQVKARNGDNTATSFGTSANGTTSSSVVPTISTPTATAILSTTATLGGNVTSDGGAAITARGVVWAETSLDPAPQLSGSNVTEVVAGTVSTGVFTTAVTSLPSATQISYSAYATNSQGTSYTPATFYTLATEPSIQASSVVFSSQTATSLVVSWTSGTGGRRAVFMKGAAGSITNPSDAIAYTASSDWNNKGTQLGTSGYYCIYDGTGSTVTVTNLTAATAYYVQVFEYNSDVTPTPATINYYTATATGNPANSITLSSDISTHAASFTAAAASTTSLTLTFSAASTITNAAGYIILQKSGNSAPTGTPTNATNYSVGNTIGDGIVAAKITNGSATSTTINGLAYASSYSFTLIPFNWNSVNTGTYNYYTAATIPSATGTTSTPTAPTITTPTSASVSITTATLGGNVTSDGGDPVTERGIVWSETSLNADPVIGGSNVTKLPGTGTTGVSTVATTGLPSGVSISYKAYATNNYGTSYTTVGTITTLASEPTIQASNINFANVGMNSMTINWINGNGTNRMVVVKASGAPGTPLDGQTYSANTIFGSGSTFGTNEYVVYIGANNTVDITGLTASISYSVKVFEYNGSGGSINYKTTSNNTTQTTAALTYYSNGSLDPALLASWKTERNGTGSSPTNFTSGESFVIESGDVMTTTSTWSISGTNSKLQIENGGTLSAGHAITLATATTFQIDNGGKYSQTAGITMSTIFGGTEEFAANSNFEYLVNPGSTTAPGGLGYGNLSITGSGATALGWGANITEVQGNLTIIGTGSGPTRHAFTGTGSNTVNIGGNFTISGGNFWLSSSTGACTVNLIGDLIINGGTLDIANSSGVGIINVGGNVIVSSGTLTEGGSTTTSKIVFNKTGTQTFTSGGTISNKVNFEVASTSTLDLGTSVISGAGYFTLPSNATLKTTNATGIAGAIMVSGTKTFSSLANYEFNGATSGTFPTTPTANTVNNLTINRSAGVTLSQSFTTTSTLTLTSGTLDIAANTLTIAGSVSRTNGNIDADAGTVSFGNSAGLSIPSSLFSGNIYNLSKASGAGTVTLTDDLTVTNELTSAASTGAFIIPSSKVLTVSGTGKATINGTLTNNGILTLNSGATLVQGTSSAIAGSGTYNVKQTVIGAGSGTPSGRFWYVGSPVSTATSAVYDAAGANILKYYSEPANAWQEITANNAALEVGRGYFVQAAAGTTELNFTGGTINNGDYPLNVTRNTTTNAFRGYNLLTNPYPSYLDWDNVTRSNVGTTMWYRSVNNAGTMVFDTYNAPAGTGTNNNQTGAVTRYIPPMQSFWVNVPQGQTTGTVSFGNAQRSHYSTGVQGLRSSAQDFPAFLRLNLLDGSFVDQTILYMKPAANNTFDEYDSEKMFLGGVPQFYSTVNAKKLVLNGMKNQKARTSVPLTMELPTSKSYTFQAEEFNIEDGLILLEDKQEGVIQDLTINPTYSFFGNAGTNATRFVVHFQLANAPILVGGPQELESLGSDELMSENIQIVSNNQGTVIIRLDEGFKPEGSIRIFDASGRLVEQTDFNDQETTIQLNEQAGMYFVEVAAGKLMVKKKIVIN